MPLTPKLLPLVLALVLLPGLGWAQGVLRDPTQPPPGVQAAAGQSTASDAGLAGAQSVIRITPVGEGRQQAVLGGRTLQAGETLGAWRVVNITAAGVVLKDSRGTRTVTTPAQTVRKKPVSAPVSAP